MRKRRQDVEQSVKDGRTPFYLDLTQATEEEIRYVEWSYHNEGLCWILLQIMKDHGIDFRREAVELELEEPGRLTGGFLAPFIDTDCRTSVDGLFACSPIQFAGEVAAPTYVVLGWRAGEKAADYAKTARQVEPEISLMEAEETRATTPIRNQEGPTWSEVNRELNNIMEEFSKYVAGFNPPGHKDQRSITGIQNCIKQLATLKQYTMKAADPHELVRCCEVMNLIDVGLMMVTAALDDRLYKSGVWFLGKRERDTTTFHTKHITVKYPPKEAA